MINHGLTLLINRDGDGYGGQLGDEFIDPNFRQMDPLPGYLRNIRQILMGTNPDRVFQNYRAHQYLALIHSSELEKFLFQLDSRVTYDIDNDAFFSPDTFMMLPSDDGLFVHGTPATPDATGQSFQRWRITVLTSDTVQVQKLIGSPRTVVSPYDVTDGLSSAVSLVGSDLFVRFRPIVDKVWEVKGYARPAMSLSGIVAQLRGVGAQYMADLFAVGSPAQDEEPLRTFRNLWYSNPFQSYHLGALVLAVIYTTEAIRNGQRHERI